MRNALRIIDRQLAVAYNDYLHRWPYARAPPNSMRSVGRAEAQNFPAARASRRSLWS